MRSSRTAPTNFREEEIYARAIIFLIIIMFLCLTVGLISTLWAREGKVIKLRKKDRIKTIVRDTSLKPDLVVTGCTFTPANPATSDRVMIRVNMKNQGTVAAVIPAGASEWRATLPSGRGSGGSAGAARTVAPGETFFGGVYMLEQSEVAAGTYSVRVQVDPDNRLGESNEANNELRYNLQIRNR